MFASDEKKPDKFPIPVMFPTPGARLKHDGTA